MTELTTPTPEPIGHSSDGTPIFKLAQRTDGTPSQVALPEEFRKGFLGEFLTNISVDRELIPRGIDPAVWAKRGCRYYLKGDPSIKEEFESFFTNPKSGETDSRTRLATATKIVNECGGWFMPKHAPPGLPPIAPQLRPDRPIVMDGRETWHYHGPQTERDDRPVFPEEAGTAAGKYLPKKRIMFGVTAELHVAATGDPYDPATGEGEHNGIPVDIVHRHAPDAAKYTFLAPEGQVSRIDLHPWAWKLLPNAECVFFVLEGTPKTDAVLSAGGVAFGVPSVTCWDPAELTMFALAYLRDKVVLVVPDADWATKWQVERQALKVRTLLRRIGIESHICAPPHDVDDYHKGVDDFLGAGHTLGDLVIEGREVPADLIAEAVSHLPYQRRPSAARALEDLALHVRPDGTLKAGFQTLRYLLGVHHANRVLPLLRSIEHTFTIPDGSLEVITRTRHFGRYKETMWKDNPTIEMDLDFITWAKRAKLTATDFEVDALRAELDELKAKVHEIERR